jgi:parallel beta-helix repeat protein
MKQINTMRASLLSLLLVAITGLTAYGQLNGTYTVYGTSPNYATLQDAVNALTAGVSGPVTFKIRPGTWSSTTTSIANLGAVAGASATNTITFEAENGNAATTTISNTNTSTATTSNHVFYFNGSKYIRVRNLTLSKTSTSAGTIVRFAGDADYNIVENCVLTGGSSTTTSTNMARVYGTSLASADNNIIRNNTFNFGSYGVYWSGNSTTSLSSDNEFSGNTMVSPYYMGFYTYYTNNQQILNNTITRTGAGTFYGFYAYYADGAFKINGNSYTGTSITGTNYPINMYYCDATNANRGSVDNNIINVSSSTSIYNYIYYSNHYSVSGNKITMTSPSGTLYPLYNYNYTSTTYDYGNNVNIDNNEFTATTSGTIQMYTHYYYNRNGTFNGNKVTFNGSTGSQSIYAGYYLENFKFNNNTINITITTGQLTYYAGYYEAINGFEYIGNTLNVTAGSASYCYIYAGYYNYNNYGTTIINNNKHNVTFTGSYLYHYLGYYNIYNTVPNECKDNTINLTGGTSTYAYNYMGYYMNGCITTGNVINVKSGLAAYGLMCYGYSSGTVPWTIKNNKVTVVGGGSTVYGLYGYYCYKPEISNNVIYAYGTSTLYAFACGYNKDGAKIYNNTVYGQSTSTNYTFYCYQYTGSEFADVRNNVIMRAGGTSGYLCYLGHPNYYSMDYNNFVNGGATMVYYGNVGTTYASLTPWRAGTNMNRNSLTYNPGFISTTSTSPDLRPDPANPNSWSLNGRGVQLAGNDKDIDGNNRALTTVQGVPDIGAYEFVPTSTPPNCTVAPAPAPSGTSVVSFGEDTVAVLRWSATVPTGFAVKQYTGTNPPGVTTINPTQMFYYADFQGTGTALDYEQDLYFKDPWMGSIASKSALRLAEKVGTSAWSGYPSAASSSNVIRNFIATPSVDDVGALFTGIDVSNNASADAIIEPVPPFCPGTYAVKLRIKNNGNNVISNVKIDYSINGQSTQTINYTTPININGSPQGNEAIINLGNVNFGSSAVNIKAWTYQPNGVQDPIPGDDTLNKDYFAALGGTYTVGGVNPNFPTVIAAANALSQYGTCGDVIFDIRPGTYTGKVLLNNPVPVPNTSGRVTFRSENGNKNSVTIAYASPVTNVDPAVHLNDADRFTFKNLTITANGTYGQAIGFYGAADDDSVIGCNLNVTSTVLTSYNSVIMAYTGYTSFNGKNLVLKDNVMDGGYYNCWIYPGTYQPGYVIDNNQIMNAGYMGMYVFYTYGIKITNNTISAHPTSSNCYYGMYNYYAYQSPQVTGNRIYGFYGMGMYMPYAQGTSTNRMRVANNSVLMRPGQSGNYAIYLYDPRFSDVINNTFIYNGSNNTNSYGAYIYAASNPPHKFMNNVFANLGGGYAAYVYLPTGSGNEMNHNNLYTNGTSSFMTGLSTASSLAAWRAATTFDAQSVSYDPAITSGTDAKPDVKNPAVWALNGHGVHIVGNNKDIDGNPRVETRPDGVPDIGAYEVVPEVQPPLATAVPAIADKGDTQIFTFAGNEVGRITWGQTAPVVGVEVRQYSGEKGTGIAAAASPTGSMYFHTDIRPLGNGTTYDFDLNIDYMDIWLGDIATESNLRLAHLVQGYPWMVYSGSLSSSNPTTNNIDAQKLNRFGSFSALENNSVASAFVRAQGSVIICTGNSVQLNAEPQDGDYYKWYRNGVAIPGADGAQAKSYLATQAGDYSVEITFSGKSVESVPVTVSTIAPPNAIVNANRPLTYCVGNGLTLDAGTGQGLSYQWQLNGNDIPGATGNTYPVNQPGTYNVVVTNVGCSSVSTVSTVTSGPISVDLGNDTSYCEVKNVWATLDAGYPGAKYLWSTGDTSRIIEVKQAGKFWVEVDGGPNCTGVDTIEVTIDKLPTANGISFVQNGNNYQFYPSGPVGAKGFLWLFSDGSTSTQQNPTKQINGELYVRLVMFNQCGADTVQLGWPLGVEQVLDENAVSVYPNPAKGQITVNVSGSVLKEVEVLNSVGSVVYRGVVNGGDRHSVDVSGLANGHYMLRATTENGVVSKQFDVMK